MRNKINSILKLLNSDDNSLIFNANSPDTIYCSLMAPYLHMSMGFPMECRHECHFNAQVMNLKSSANSCIDGKSLLKKEI